MQYKKKGLTLVELIIVIALLGIVMLVISNFFFANYKALNRESNEIDFQSEGEKALNFIIKEAMISKGIKAVYINNAEVDINNAVNISKLVLGSNDSNIEKGFEVIDNGGSKQLNYYTIDSTGVTSKVELSNLVKSLDISSDKELKAVSSIKIKLTLTKGRNPIFESHAYFRNK